MFGKIAGRYDFLNHLLSLGIDHYWRWRTVRIVPPSGPLPILDVCTGTGDLALAFSKKVGERGQVVHTDINEAMLRTGRDEAILRYAAQDDISIDSLAAMFGLSRRTIFRVLKRSRRAFEG